MHISKAMEGIHRLKNRETPRMVVLTSVKLTGFKSLSNNTMLTLYNIKQLKIYKVPLKGRRSKEAKIKMERKE